MVEIKEIIKLGEREGNQMGEEVECRVRLTSYICTSMIYLLFIIYSAVRKGHSRCQMCVLTKKKKVVGEIIVLVCRRVNGEGWSIGNGVLSMRHFMQRGQKLVVKKENGDIADVKICVES